MPLDPADHLPFAHRLADAAGEVVRRYYRTDIAVDAKADASPVTAADREAERAMRALINAHHPEHGIAAEEFGVERADAELVWCLDPIDGTRAFVAGRPLFGTLISLTHRGRPVLGIIDVPVLRERWVGAAGQPSTLGDSPVRTRACAGLGAALLSTTSPLLFRSDGERAAFARVQGAAREAIFGGDCYGYGLLAMGYADVIVETGLDDHDFCALVPVVEGAGGVITDWRGEPLRAGSAGDVLACGDARVHDEALRLLAG